MVNPYRFYTYAYLRKDKTPYYIGKGVGNRAYKKSKNEIKPPKDKSRVIFLKQNLTEEEAFKHEIYMIAVFGRKDLGTGILHNKTDGGDGVRNMSEITKKKISVARKGIIFSDSHRENIGKVSRGKKLSSDRKKQMSLQSKKNWENPDYRKKQIEHLKNRKPPIRSGENHHKAYKWEITFNDNTQIVKCGLVIWAKDNNYDYNKLYLIAKGKRKSHKDIVAVKRLDTVP